MKNKKKIFIIIGTIILLVFIGIAFFDLVIIPKSCCSPCKGADSSTVCPAVCVPCYDPILFK